MNSRADSRGEGDGADSLPLINTRSADIKSNKQNLHDRLLEIQCPFTFGLEKYFENYAAKVQVKKLLVQSIDSYIEYRSEEDTSDIHISGLLLGLTYICFLKEDYYDAKKYLTRTESAVKKEDVATKHMILGTKAYISFHQNHYKESEGILNDIVRYENLTKKEKAKVIGVKGCIHREVGDKHGRKKAIEIFKEACNLDSENNVYPLEISRTYDLIRRLDGMDTNHSEELLKYARDSVGKGASPLILAEALVETGRAEFFKNGIDNIDPYFSESSEIYDSELAVGLATLTRCADGMMRMLRPYQNIQHASEIYKLVTSIDSNPFLNLKYAKILEAAKNYEEACVHYEKAIYHEKGVFVANWGFLRLKIRTVKGFSPKEHLEDMLRTCGSPKNTMDIYCALGYIYHRVNVIEAFKYFKLAEDAVSPQNFTVLGNKITSMVCSSRFVS